MGKNKHTKSDLLQWQSLPLPVKIRMSQMRIRDWYDYWDHVYISFSGGKDSTVLKHLVETTLGEQYNPDTDSYEAIPSLFVNTGLEYPEIQKFAMSQPNVITVRPEKRFDEVIKEYGYPVISKEISHKIWDYRKKPDGYMKKQFDENYRGVAKYKEIADSDLPISHKCCDVMKKKPAHDYEKVSGRKPFIGTMACESILRQSTWIRQGCNAFEKNRPTSQPLSFWTESDILQYIVENKLDYCSLYGDILQDKNGKYYNTGVERTGCMFCMFGAQCRGDRRFLDMKESHPKQYNYCMKDVEDGGLGLDKVLNFMNIEH